MPVKVGKPFGMLALSVAGVCLCSTPTLADDDFSDQAIIELVDADNTDINDIVNSYPDLIEVIGEIPNFGIYLIQLLDVMSEEDFEDLHIEDDARVDDAELNDDPDTNDGNTQDFFFAVLEAEYSGHYTWPLIGTTRAQQRSTGNGILVAILDTGVDSTHSVLAGRVVEGYNFLTNNNNTGEIEGNGINEDGDFDEFGEPIIDEMFGHGTFMAGIIARIAPESMILPVTVLNDDGIGYSFIIAQGIYYAIERGADVINLSMGTNSENDILEDAIEYAKHNGVVVIAAAGNSEENVTLYPARFSSVIAVAGTDANDVKSVFSNFGEDIDLCAPASDMVSTFPGNEYAQNSGTSMAAAVVSGSAALVLADHPSWNSNEERIKNTKRILSHSATDIEGNEESDNNQLGSGRINIDAAMEASRRPYDPDDPYASDDTLINFELAIGRVLDGGLDEIKISDDDYLHTRSGFGSTFAELHTTRLNITAISEVENPIDLRVVIEGYIDQAAGIAKVKLFNWQSSNYEPVEAYSIGLNEEMFVINGLDASRYINESREIKVQINHVVFVPFFAFTFESYIDHVSIEVD